MPRLRFTFGYLMSPGSSRVVVIPCSRGTRSPGLRRRGTGCAEQRQRGELLAAAESEELAVERLRHVERRTVADVADDEEQRSAPEVEVDDHLGPRPLVHHASSLVTEVHEMTAR